MMNEELQYLLVVVGLFVVPRLLQRLRLPGAITCVGIGALLGMGMGFFHDDTVVPLLATLGIVSLFLFAGMEVDLHELRQGARVTAGHIVVQVLLMAVAAYLAHRIFGLAWRPSLLFSLALVTPSTGFILDSLPSFGLTERQNYWVKTKAIATEVVALAALFVTVQSGSLSGLAISTAALVSMVAVLPWLFQLFARWVLPHAPRSEFAFLMTLALVCAFITRRLGVYYLVGAFVVGVTAVRLRQRIPAMASERIMTGIELFASFFIPFYFFKAGLHLERDNFSLTSLLYGLGLVAVAVPLRIGVVAAHRFLALGEPWRQGARVGLSLVPTLVFTLVLAGILRERYQLSGTLFGALVVFALVDTVLPGFILKSPPPEFTAPEAPRPGEHAGADETVGVSSIATG